MPIADWVFPNFGVKETTTTTGIITTTTNKIALGGAADGHRPFSLALGNGKRATIVLKGADPPGGNPDWEALEVSYDSVNNALDLLSGGRIDSSLGGSPIDWPVGTRDVYISLHGLALQELLNPEAVNGILVRDGKHSYTARTIKMATGADALAWTFGSGVNGPPTLSELFKFLARDGDPVTDAQRTMVVALILANLHTQITGLPHEFRGSGGAGDVALKLTRNGTQDYTAQVGRGGSLANVLTNADQLIAVYPATSTEVSVLDTLRDQLTVTVPVPATGGPFHISVDLMVHGAITCNGIQNAEILVTLQQNGSPVDANRLGIDFSPLQTDIITKRGGIPVFYDFDVPVAGTSYVFRPVVTFAPGSGAEALELPTNGKHRIRATLYTRSN